MLINQTAEYALRAMARLALLPPGAAMRASVVAEATGVPPHYLSKILRRLVIAGLIDGRKGHGGGFRLAKAPADIALGDILCAFEADPGQPRCVFGWGECDDADPCPLHPAWTSLSRSYRAWAASTTLAEVRAGSQWTPDSSD